MAYDYSDDLAFAQEIITEFGAQWTFERLDTSIDPTDPLGPGIGVPTTVALPGVGIEVMGNSFGRYVDLSDLIKDHARVILTPGYAADDIETFNLVTDADGVSWTMGRVMSFEPGAVRLLHFVGINK